LDPKSAWGDLAWPSLPAELAPEAVRVAFEQGVAAKDLPLESLPGEVWKELIARQAQLATLWSSPLTWQGLPEAQLDVALASLGSSGNDAASTSPAWPVLWHRFEAGLTEALGEGLRGANSVDIALLNTAPPAAAPNVLQKLEDTPGLVNLPRPKLDSLRRWLHLQISRRAPEWPRAYQLLAKLENALAPLGK
jgi:hypothetical protein